MPLGGTYPELGSTETELEDVCFFKVYVPTKYGGHLMLQTTSGNLVDLVAPYGTVSPTGFDPLDAIDMNQSLPLHGWYYFRNTAFDPEAIVVSSSFNQNMTSNVDDITNNKNVWDYYYWPNKLGTNLYSDSAQGVSPLEDYDNFYGTTAKQEELSHYDFSGPIQYSTESPVTCETITPYEVESWHGHCQGGAIASVLYSQPIPNNNSFSQDELEGLYAQYYESSSSVGGLEGYGDYYWAMGLPAEVPTSLSGEKSDRYCSHFHQSLERMLAGKKSPLLVNLRSSSLSDENGNSRGREVWNQAIYAYSASYEEVGDAPLRSRVQVTIFANSSLNYPSLGLTARMITYDYTIRYQEDGIAFDGFDDMNNMWIDDPELNWISVSGDGVFTPGTVVELESVSEIQVLIDTMAMEHKCNSEVTLANIIALDSNNE